MVGDVSRSDRQQIMSIGIPAHTHAPELLLIDLLDQTPSIISNSVGGDESVSCKSLAAFRYPIARRLSLRTRFG